MAVMVLARGTVSAGAASAAAVEEGGGFAASVGLAAVSMGLDASTTVVLQRARCLKATG